MAGLDLHSRARGALERLGAARAALLGTLVSAYLSFGCAPRPATTPGDTRAGIGDGASERARAIIASVVALRGLSEMRPITTRVVDDGTFASLFRANVARSTRHVDRGGGGGPPPEVYLGFYDQFSKTIILREHTPAWASNSGLEPQDLLAHEVAHALQDQHFGMPEMAAIDDDDRALALRALYEGDAQLVMAAYRARRLHRSWKTAVLGAYKEAEFSADLRIRAGLFSPSLLALPVAARDAVAFPYAAGAAFASALYRTGGFDLIDRALAHPPRTTAEVIELQRYLDGDSPAQFGRLPVPSDARNVRERSIGEFELGWFVSELSHASGSPALKRTPTFGCRGARIAQFELPGAGASVLLATEWRTPQDAKRFAAAVRVPFLVVGPKVEGSAWAVVQDGTSVGVVTAPGASLLAPGLLHVARPDAPAAPPFGPLTVPPPPPGLGDAPELRGQASGSRYESAWLSVRAQIPPRFVATTTNPAAQVLLTRKEPSVAVGAFSVVPLDGVAGEMRQIHRIFIEALVESLPKASQPEAVASAARDTPFGPGNGITWRIRFDKGAAFARSVAVAVCDGQAAFQWGTFWVDEDGEHALEDWTRSFASIAAASRPLCDDLGRENAAGNAAGP
ncbi:MAG TPA: hypothetical protein VE987_22905 [Polyangiaceae bacterium]|nr:hypothetical protein [Polyangiaceae bacterium]